MCGTVFSNICERVYVFVFVTLVKKMPQDVALSQLQKALKVAFYLFSDGNGWIKKNQCKN